MTSSPDERPAVRTADEVVTMMLTTAYCPVCDSEMQGTGVQLPVNPPLLVNACTNSECGYTVNMRASYPQLGYRRESK